MADRPEVEAAREKLYEILWREGDFDGREYHIAQAILAAGFVLIAPTEDVREAARDVVVEYQLDRGSGRANRLIAAIAAALTAHAAREREAIFDHRDPNQEDIADMRHALSVHGCASDGPSAEDVGFRWQSHVRRLLRAIRARSTP